MAVNLGGRKEVVEPQTKPTSSKPKQNKNSLTFLGVTLVLVIALCIISITISTCKTLSDKVDSLYIDTFNRQKEVYESKGGVISTIQTNQFEVLRK